jgi:pSer/pThr/pTyr-binding forkhead associated (FHA) protein
VAANKNDGKFLVVKLGVTTMPTLTLSLKNKFIKEYKLKKGTGLTIGRRETNDIVIDDPAVSGHHAKIDVLGERLVLTDLQSKNGSFVNEQLVQSQWLKDEDVITIGEHSLLLNDDSKKQAAADDVDDFDETQSMNTTQYRKMMKKSNPTKSINVARFWNQNQNRGKVRNVAPSAPEAPTDEPATGPVGTLDYLDGGLGRIELNRKITTIGTDPTSDVVIKGLLMDPTAATINKVPEGFCFNYIGGRPRPKINGAPVESSTFLAASDIIQIGSARLQFSIEEP